MFTLLWCSQHSEVNEKNTKEVTNTMDNFINKYGWDSEKKSLKAIRKNDTVQYKTMWGK